MDSWAAFTSFDFIGTEDLCVTMDQSERSYQLLGGYAAGQLLYTLQSDPNETMYIVFSPHRSYDSEPPKVKLPTLNATAEHLVACQYKWFLFWDYLLGFCTLINWVRCKKEPKDWSHKCSLSNQCAKTGWFNPILSNSIWSILMTSGNLDWIANFKNQHDWIRGRIFLWKSNPI